MAKTNVGKSAKVLSCFDFLSFLFLRKIKKLSIKVNGEVVETSNQILAKIIDQLNLVSKGIAVAINDEVVPKTDWQNFELKENDEVLIITATQGG